MHTNSKFNRWQTFVRALKKRSVALAWCWGGSAGVALIAISCSGGSRVIFAPPSVPGATFVGTESCAECHEEINRDFKTADHARLSAKGKNASDVGCEACHGPGSKHVESGGALATIVNPGDSPQACMKCHINVQSSFNLPYSHPVMSGKMTCSDCHDPHKGSSMKGGGTQLAGINATCINCHTQQMGPFVFEHEATREGCVSCHSPHGSTNQKMLTERNATLCLKCHFQDQSSTDPDRITIGGGGHSSGRMSSGACWTSGCHEAVHGSNVSHHLRN